MPVIRKNQRDERRRRALMDDAPPKSEECAPRQSTRKRAPQNSYSEEARVCNQPRITDFIPTRLFSVWVILLSGLVVCCLNATCGLVYFERFQVRYPEFQRLFQPSAAGSFAAWTSSVMLLVAAAIGVLTLWIRRFRIDDYRGRYRIWFFIPVFLAIASIDAIVGVSKISALNAAEIQLGFATAKVSHLLICFFGIAVGVRLLLEIRPSKAATTLLISSGACYLLSFLVSWHTFSVLAGQTELISYVTALTGNWLLCTCLLANLRFIFLDSQGEIAAMQNKKSQQKMQAKKDKEAAARSKAAAAAAKKANSSSAQQSEKPDVVPMTKPAPPEKTNKPTVAPKAQSKKKTPQQATKTTAASNETDEPDQNNATMSRAERKRLRKEKKKNRRAA